MQRLQALSTSAGSTPLISVATAEADAPAQPYDSSAGRPQAPGEGAGGEGEEGKEDWELV